MVAFANVMNPTLAFARQSGVLHVGLDGRDMGTLHPHVATAAQDTAVISSIFNGLVRYVPGKVSVEAIEPDLAESWTVSDDFKQYSFKLRHGVKWHKGYGEFTSEDVKFSLLNVRDSVQSTFRPIFSNIERIDTPDKYEVVIALKTPDPVFIAVVSGWQGGYVICKKAVEVLGDTYKNQPVGTGPFQFEEFRPKERVSLVANPDYYGGTPKLKRIIYSYIPDQTARRYAFVQQEIDIMKGAANEDWLSEVVNASKDKPLVDLLGPGRNVVIHLKRSVPPLDNLKIRLAIAHAINREDYQRFFGRVFEPNFGPIPLEYFGAIEPNEIPQNLLYKHDPDRARQLLAEAGFKDGLKLETVVSERGDYLGLAQIGKQQLSKVGIDLKLNVLDNASWVAAIIKEKKGSLVWSTAARYPSAETLIREFWICAADVTKPTGVQGFAEYCNAKLDTAYQTAIAAADPKERAKYFKQVQTILLEDMPSVTLGSLATPVLRQSYVDLGYQVKEGTTVLSLPYMYYFTEKTNV
ncbi:MAG: hypothetical protein IH626_21350 [Rhodospirillales bacterium]|nr:hypothetical protein [Rhodospirillales bacterium]